MGRPRGGHTQPQGRCQVKEKHPEANFVEVNRLLGDGWKQLDDDERAKYDDMAKEDKVPTACPVLSHEELA